MVHNPGGDWNTGRGGNPRYTEMFWEFFFLCFYGCFRTPVVVISCLEWGFSWCTNVMVGLIKDNMLSEVSQGKWLENGFSKTLTMRIL